MKLFLTSSGFTTPELVDDFKGLVGMPVEELAALYVPTAANAEAEDKQWMIEDMHRCAQLGFNQLDVIDIAIPADIWKPRVEAADVIIVGGGSSAYLFEQMEASGFGAMLPGLLDSKIYVGISAGSMVLGPEISNELSQKFFNERLGGTFGVTDFWIKPHINSPQFPDRTFDAMEQIFADAPHPVYALDDQSAVMVQDGVVSVVGAGEWRLIS